MSANKILVKGRVEPGLKKNFLREWRQFNKAEVEQGRKAISQGKFFEILVAESVKDGDGAPEVKGNARLTKGAATRARPSIRPAG